MTESKLLTSNEKCCFVTKTKQSICHPFTWFFFEQKGKGNHSEKSLFFLMRRTNKGEMGNPKRRKSCVILE